MHKDGFTRFQLPGTDHVIYQNFFFNVIMPLQGDIPTLFRGPDNKMHASPMCAENEIRIFNGEFGTLVLEMSLAQEFGNFSWV